MSAGIWDKSLTTVALKHLNNYNCYAFIVVNLYLFNMYGSPVVYILYTERE